MKKKVVVKALAIIEVWIDEDIRGNQEIDSIESVRDIQEFEIIETL